MKKLLITSAAILALSIGTHAYAEKDYPSGHPERGAHMEERMKERLAGLPEDKQAMVLDMFKKQREGKKESWEQGKKLHDEMKAILTAPTFDEKSFIAKSKEIDALHQTRRDEHRKTMVKIASQLNQEERKILAEAFKPKDRHHRGKMDRDGMRDEKHEGMKERKHDKRDMAEDESDDD